MPDYKEMYLKMLRASEQAMNILIGAQRACEELYVSASETDFEAVAPISEHEKGVDDEQF